MAREFDSRSFDRMLQAPERKWHAPRLDLRQRSHDHPLAMFATIASAGFISMALIPTTGPAFASIGKPAPVKLVEEVRTTVKSDRLQPANPTDIACKGQAWGTETAECLTVIAKVSGKSDLAVRLIASAEPNGAVPNIF